MKKSTANSHASSPVIERRYLYPFILVTSLFALWGFANDLTNPLVRAFKDIFLISNAQSSLVQWAFYGGYATMAIPAAIIIRKVSYKSGIVVGLSLYALGALLTIPAAGMQEFNYFLIGFYILTFGLAFLETSANPFILSMGSPETATRRLNLAQAFNPIGSLTGMIVASTFILPNLQVSEFIETERVAHPEYREMLPSKVDEKITQSLETHAETQPTEHQEMVRHDLGVVKIPYVVIAGVVLGVLALFLLSKMPDTGQEEEQIRLGALFRHLFFNFHYIGGVIAQIFYVGAQIMCWTFIIHYGMTLVGLSAAEAQNHNIAAMILFLSGRFFFTWTLKFINAGVLLSILSAGGLLLTLGAIFTQGILGIYFLIAVSGCMSVMFPTIYGIALEGLTPNDAKLGSAGLIFAIVGGALLPRLQGTIIDGNDFQIGGMMLESIRVSFFLPVLCFIVIGLYGIISNRVERKPRH